MLIAVDKSAALLLISACNVTVADEICLPSVELTVAVVLVIVEIETASEVDTPYNSVCNVVTLKFSARMATLPAAANENSAAMARLASANVAVELAEANEAAAAAKADDKLENSVLEA
jgi:hypothetical protein